MPYLYNYNSTMQDVTDYPIGAGSKPAQIIYIVINAEPSEG
ncbi:MAG: hypothetical protein ABFD00_03710 [Chloroherpetonaceae bacterium]